MPGQPSEGSAALPILRTALPDAWALYLFGSVARNQQRADSDLDLAVLLPPARRIPDLLTLQAEILQATGRDTDIVDLREAGLDLIMEVLRHGQRLHCGNTEQTLAWEAEQMSDFAAFDPRREALRDLYLLQPLRQPAAGVAER